MTRSRAEFIVFLDIFLVSFIDYSSVFKFSDIRHLRWMQFILWRSISIDFVSVRIAWDKYNHYSLWLSSDVIWIFNFLWSKYCKHPPKRDFVNPKSYPHSKYFFKLNKSESHSTVEHKIRQENWHFVCLFYISYFFLLKLNGFILPIVRWIKKKKCSSNINRNFSISNFD